MHRLNSLRAAPIAFALGAGLSYGADLAFEAASIKPSPPIDSSHGPIYFGPKGGPGTEDPGRYWCNFCNVSELVSQAYDLPEYRIFSANRLPQDRFHIVATIPAATTREQFRGMLQNLLADRFQLRLHREPREMQMFRLFVSPGGPKMRAHVDGTPEPVADKDAARQRAPGVYYKVQGKTMEEFAKVVEGQLRKPVSDVTGLSGKYDFDVWWTVDSSADGASDAPTIYTAIQSLGLKLEARKGPIEVVVVDHIEKLPTGN